MGVPRLSVSVVIPCYRSARTLPTLVARLIDVLMGVTMTFEILLVVDGDGDDTWAVARDLATRSPYVRAIRLARNYGQNAALIAGVRAARHEVTVTMDDDLQHPPDQVPRLLLALGEELDLVYGVAEHEEHGRTRNLCSHVAKVAIAVSLGITNARDLSAFRAFRTFLRGSFDLVTGPDVSVDVALSWGTTAVGAVRVRMVERSRGRSGYTFRALLRHATNMFLGYSTVPLRIATFMGFALGLAGIVLFVRLVWLYLNNETTVAGFTTIASLVAVFSAAQLVAIGVLGEYVGRIHSHGMGRPTYLIRERIGALDERATVDAVAKVNHP
jgi:undecaprenyl-phosphate 4-deoxy-4-formamido-L-arabinose transferase